MMKIEQYMLLKLNNPVIKVYINIIEIIFKIQRIFIISGEKKKVSSRITHVIKKYLY